MKKYFKLITLSFFIPFVASAQGLVTWLNAFDRLLDILPRIILGLCLVYFFWGTAQFILNAADEKNREMGKQKMFWSFIAIFVFVSIFGIIAFMRSNLNL